MISALDSLIPWFGNMVELGGNILLAIVVMAMVIITLMVERLGYLQLVYPRQQKRALAWEIIDQLAPAKGFSRKKLVPLHGAILSVLRGPGPREEVIGKIRKVLAEA